MEYLTAFNINEVYESMFKRRVELKPFKAVDYSSKRRRIVEYIYNTGQLFKITQNTVQLAIFLMDITMMKYNIPI